MTEEEYDKREARHLQLLTEEENKTFTHNELEFVSNSALMTFLAVERSSLGINYVITIFEIHIRMGNLIPEKTKIWTDRFKDYPNIVYGLKQHAKQLETRKQVRPHFKMPPTT